MDRLQAEQEAQKARAEQEKKASMNKLADDFQANVGGMIESVGSATTELLSTAESMSATAEETNRQSTAEDRKGVVWGRRVSVRLDHGGRSIFKQEMTHSQCTCLNTQANE